MNLAIRDALVRVQGSALVHDVRVDARAGTFAWRGRTCDVADVRVGAPGGGRRLRDAAQRPRRIGRPRGGSRPAALQGAAEGPRPVREAAQHPLGVRLADRRPGGHARAGDGRVPRCRDRPHRVPRARRRCARLRGRLHGRERRLRPARKLLPPDGPLPLPRRILPARAVGHRAPARGGPGRARHPRRDRRRRAPAREYRHVRAHRRAAAGRRHRVHDARARRRAADRRARGRAARAGGAAGRDHDRRRGHAGEHARRGGRVRGRGGEAREARARRLRGRDPRRRRRIRPACGWPTAAPSPRTPSSGCRRSRSARSSRWA